MRKIKCQKTKPQKEKRRKEDETDFWDIMVKAMRLGFLPRMPSRIHTPGKVVKLLEYTIKVPVEYSISLLDFMLDQSVGASFLPLS